VDLAAKGGQCVARVRNTGAPISAEDLPHVFDRFYRADKARTSGKGGYGLGLSIAQTIARDHGGDITVASSAADDTVFTVTLPLAK
jgi:signal transduction histidine kinase